MTLDIYSSYKNNNLFRIVLSGDKNIAVYKRTKTKDGYTPTAEELVVRYNKYKSIMFAYIPPDTTYHSFTKDILVNLKDDIYMYIGASIYYFRTAEHIFVFASKVINGISYPYVVTSKGYLLLAEMVFIPLKIVSYKTDFYDFFYNNPDHPGISDFVGINVCNNYLI